MSPTRVEQVAPAAIKPHPNNVRRQLGDVTELAASIKAKGILQPLVVAPNGEPGAYTLIAGHRRLAAAKSAGVDEITVVVREDLDTEAAQLEAMLVENLQRTDLTPLEEGDAYEQLLAFDGYNVKTLAAKTGRAQSTIRDRVAIAKLSDKVRSGIDQGQVTLEQALVLAEFDDDHEAQAALERALGTYNWDWTVRRARENREAAKQREKHRKALKKAGVRTVDLEDLDTDDEAWAYLEDLGDALVDDATYEALGEDRGLYLRALLAAHEDCPGHAAYLNAHGEVEYVCTAADRHETDAEPATSRGGQTGPSAEDKAAAEEARKAQEQLRSDLITAAKVRRDHLAAQIRDGDVDIAREVALEDVTHLATLSWGKEDRLPLLGLPMDADEPTIRAALEKMTLPQLVIAERLIARVSNRDDHLLRPGGWTGDWTQDWRTELAELWGYEWSDVEAILIDGDAS